MGDLVRDQNGDYIVNGVVSDSDIIRKAKEILSRKCRRKAFVSSQLAGDYIAMHLGGDDSQEHFGVMFLDSGNKLIENKILFHGTIDAATVYPREVLRQCLLVGACGVIVYHNHPSGSLEPSGADIAITRRLHKALSTFDITVLDHIIAGGGEWMSFAHSGLMWKVTND